MGLFHNLKLRAWNAFKKWDEGKVELTAGGFFGTTIPTGLRVVVNISGSLRDDHKSCHLSLKFISRKFISPQSHQHRSRLKLIWSPHLILSSDSLKSHPISKTSMTNYPPSFRPISLVCPLPFIPPFITVHSKLSVENHKKSRIHYNGIISLIMRKYLMKVFLFFSPECKGGKGPARKS